MIGFVLLLCALAWPQQTPDIRYSVVGMDVLSVFGYEPSEVQLREQLGEVLATYDGLKVMGASGEEALDARQLSGPSLMSLVALLANPANLGLEVDLVVPFEGTRFLVSVWWDKQSRVRVAQREFRGTLQPTATLKEVRALGVNVVEGPVPWEPEALGALKQAFSLLPVEDQRYLGRIEFLRAHDPDPSAQELLPVVPKNGIAAMFRLDLGPGQIEIYDGALGNSNIFVGSQQQPHSVMVRSLLHEMGHALSSKTMLDFNERVAKANGLVLEHNHRAAEFNARLAGSTQAERRELEAMSRELDALSARLIQAHEEVGPPIPAGSDRLLTAVAAAMLKVAPQKQVVTAYGRQHPEEGFAEVFAMFWADRDALRRVSPKLEAWMKSGAWRHEMDKPMVNWR